MAHPQAAQAHSTLLEPAARNVRVDELIAGSATFAQPILRYLRDLVHEAVPDATEEVKWSRPFFVVNGTSVCYIAAFSKHCALGFWSPEMTAILQSDGIDGTSGSGAVGKISSMESLPPRAALLHYLREAAARARSSGASTPMKTREKSSVKASIPVPVEFADALARSKEAASTFNGFPPSCRREYLEWITSAKKLETREKRIGQAIAMLETGKRFNEQYRSK